MDFTSGVGKVISSALILSLTLLFSFLVAMGFNLSITSTIIISFIFMVMVIEDYMYLTIDLRILGILAFAGIFASNYGILAYLLLLLLGVFYYRIIYLFLINYETKTSSSEPEAPVDLSKALGFLPSLACGLVIYAFYRIVNSGNPPDFLVSFYDSCNEIYMLAFEEPQMIALMFMPFIGIWMFLEFKRYRAEKNNKVVIPQLGDGDVYVMAVWLAILGLADMFMVLFVSGFVQILAFTYRDKIKNKFCIGGK